jgi:hypothetical protein
VLRKAKLLVRVNPIYENSQKEIESVISNGADIVMLPFFSTTKEVEKFIGIVDGRAITCLLVETPSAVNNIDEILSVDGIDMIHIGLNDLHLGCGMKFMFEPLADGTVDMLCKKFQEQDITYGFGGIARLCQGLLPAEHIVAEHYRLGSSMAILSRSFVNTGNSYNDDEIKWIFINGVKEIRDYERSLCDMDISYFEENHQVVISKVKEIVEGAS